MNPISPDAPLTNADRERLYLIKRAVAAGTFHISADDVATKLILSMLESVDVPSLSETTSSSETEVEGLPLDQKKG
jgi:Anti-sigma-28 factor, FlgM